MLLKQGYVAPRLKSSLQKFRGGHHNLIDRYEISISQMTMYHFLYHCKDLYRTWMYLWVTWRVSYKKQELLIIREHLSSSRFFGGVRVAHRFSFLYFLIMCLYVLSSVLWGWQRFPIKTMFGSSLPPLVCRRFHVLLCVLTFLVPCCGVDNDFP